MSQPEDGPSLLVGVVDDEPLLLRAMGALLESRGHRALLFDDSIRALAALVPAGVDAAVLDLDMPLLDGVDLARCLRSRWGGTGPPLVLVSGNLDRLGEKDAPLFDALFPKPFDPDVLLRAVRSAVDARRWRALERWT